jgi:hypothetical protein
MAIRERSAFILIQSIKYSGKNGVATQLTHYFVSGLFAHLHFIPGWHIEKGCEKSENNCRKNSNFKGAICLLHSIVENNCVNLSSPIADISVQPALAQL